MVFMIVKLDPLLVDVNVRLELNLKYKYATVTLRDGS